MRIQTPGARAYKLWLAYALPVCIRRLKSLRLDELKTMAAVNLRHRIAWLALPGDPEMSRYGEVEAFRVAMGAPFDDELERIFWLDFMACALAASEN